VNVSRFLGNKGLKVSLTQTALIQIKVSDNIATIAFDNYARRNALSAALITEMPAALEEFKSQGFASYSTAARGQPEGMVRRP
jgi:hypothetical protein